MDIKLPPFYIGQTVICLKTVIKKSIIKDITYKVDGIQKCPHGTYYISCGVKHNLKKVNSFCTCCNSKMNDYGYYWEFTKNFSPLQESTFPSLTFKEVIKKEKELISMN